MQFIATWRRLIGQEIWEINIRMYKKINEKLYEVAAVGFISMSLNLMFKSPFRSFMNMDRFNNYKLSRIFSLLRSRYFESSRNASPHLRCVTIHGD